MHYRSTFSCKGPQGHSQTSIRYYESTNDKKIIVTNSMTIMLFFYLVTNCNMHAKHNNHNDT